MNSFWGKTFYSFSLTLLALSACTDKRQPEMKVPVRVQRAPREMIEAVGDIRITKGATTANISVYQMLQKNGSIYVTGTADSGVNLGFARWDISSDPESPTPVFNVGDNIDDFQPIKRWRPDWYGSGGMAVLGPYVIMSGIVGTSFINNSQTSDPVETKRYPMVDTTQPTTPKDENYVYKAIVPHPSQALIYGLREMDHIVVSTVSQNGIKPVTKIPYGSSNVCCVQGATVFGSHMFVGMRGMLRAYPLSSNGMLGTPIDLHSLQAVNVASSPDLLYVQHQPSYGRPEGTDKAGGIYVFDMNGDSIAYLPIEPIKFVVSDDNTHLYANMDDTSVRIFRISWTNQ